MYSIEFSSQALEDLRSFEKYEQNIIIDGIEANLVHEPLTETRNRKPLGINNTATWELRIGIFRVFYDVDTEIKIVAIQRIGGKRGNAVFLRGRKETL